MLWIVIFILLCGGAVLLAQASDRRATAAWRLAQAAKEWEAEKATLDAAAESAKAEMVEAFDGVREAMATLTLHAEQIAAAAAAAPAPKDQ
jgi:hypothetical protein